MSLTDFASSAVGFHRPLCPAHIDQRASSFGVHADDPGPYSAGRGVPFGGPPGHP